MTFLNHGYNYRFIGPNKDIQGLHPNHEYTETFDELSTLRGTEGKNILVVSGGRELVLDEVEKNKRKIKAIVSRGVGIDNFGDINSLKELGILVGNNPGHSQYNTFLHSLGFLYKACEILGITSFEELRRKRILIIGRGVISQTLLYFLSLCGCLQTERISSLNTQNEHLNQYDIVFLSTSLQKENIECINQDSLTGFKGVLINTSRDRLVNEVDIYQKVKEGEMNYITDVLSVNSPLKELGTGFFSTPHIGGRSSDIDFVVTSLIKNLSLILSGNQKEHQAIDFLHITKQVTHRELLSLDFGLLKEVYNEKIINGRTISSGLLGKIKVHFG